MKHSGDAPPTDAPPQTDTVKWARLLAAARFADKTATVDPRKFYASPLIKARLESLLPIARALYDEKVLKTAQDESARVDAIIAHCGNVADGEEQWDEEECQRQMKDLLIPASLASLRPRSPELIGAVLIPQSLVWVMLRQEMMPDLDKRQCFILRTLAFNAVKRSKRLASAVQPLRGVRLVDAVLGRAPAVVRLLPARWTSSDTTSDLLAALVALLKLPSTRPLSELVEELSEEEYALLVEEHSRLSRALDSREPSGEYAPLLDLLGKDASLEPVPHRMANSGPTELEIAAVIRHALPQMDTVAWACMLAAARVAERTATSTHIDPVKLAQMRLLLPIARALYERLVLRTAKAESERIDTIIAHCRDVVKAEEARESPAFKRGATEEQWNKEDCVQKMRNLRIPSSPTSLRPASPEMIGVQLIPVSSVWHLVRKARREGVPETEIMSSAALYQQRINAIERGYRKPEQMELLGRVRFFEHIFNCAPALVRSLPAGWTSGDLTNEYIEALLALVKLAGTRPLGELRLSDEEYAVLVKERDCLSQLLDGGAWKSECAKGRHFEEYVAFVEFLQQDGSFGGTLAEVPARMRQRVDEAARAAAAPRPLTVKTAVRKPVKRRRRKHESSADEESLDTLPRKRQREEPLDLSIFDPVDWVPRDLGGVVERVPQNGAWDPWAAEGLTKLERSASGATVVSLGVMVAAAALGLFALAVAVAFRLRARRGLGR